MTHPNDEYTAFTEELDADPLRHLELQCEYLKSYDPITGLPQLAQFLSQADRAAIECSKRERPVSIIALSFDSTADTGALYGLDGGNLLRAIARKLRASLRAEQFFARVGNKFLVFLPAANEAQATALARRLVNGGMELDVDGSKMVVAACAGSATLEFWSDDPKRNVRCAMDRAFTALHASWQRAAGLATTHTEELGRQLRRKSVIERDVSQAVQRGQLYLLYQPIVTPATGEIVAVEALARWNHPELGIVSPSEFVPVIERAGLAQEFDQCVLEQALKGFKPLWSAGKIDLHVNVAASSLEAHDAVESRLEAIDDAGIPRSAVVLELTETVQAKHFDTVYENVQRLRKENVRVAIDDLGCGYNTLQFFARMPVDLVKIDRSMLARENGNEILVLLEGILDTCGRLGIGAVFEGIETEEQHRLAIDTNVRYAQGYHYAVPLPIVHVLAMLTNKQ